MAAKMQKADGIFVPDPFGAEHGLMNDDGTAGELLLPWRTTALSLAGAEYLGSLQLPGGSQNRVFLQNGKTTLVVWNDTPKHERFYLGEDVQQMDIWGRKTTPEQEGGQQGIDVGPVPTSPSTHPAPNPVCSISRRGALSSEGRSQAPSRAVEPFTRAAGMLVECRLEEWAESIDPSSTCAQLQAACILTMLMFVVGVAPFTAIASALRYDAIC